jgi:23S rRNA (cytidine1920-2'-O)/16S rRNA (cytidine1409-2'-O)-methyltransferase
MGGAATARLDAELVRRGLARSRGRAAALVAQGRVRVAGTVALKASRPVLETDALEVEEPAGVEYVSRAAHKLIGALDAVGHLTTAGPLVEGAWCLDVGASTGGFTQVLLERGAAGVVAVDVGHGQMSTEVLADPRVELREGTNIRDLRPGDLDPAPGLVVADLSFISLSIVAAGLLALTAPDGHLLLMVKPQFEVGRQRLGASGVVTSAALRQEAVLRVADAVVDAGGQVHGVVPSPLPGPAGNHEYFVWAQVVAGPARPPDRAALADVVRGAVVDDRAGLLRRAEAS